MTTRQIRSDRCPRDSHRHEEGSALLVSVMLLVLMAMIGFASLETVTRDRQVAGYQTRSRTALYAADAGIAVAANTLAAALSASANLGVASLATVTPALPATTLGDTSVHPHGQPSFGPEPGVTPIRYLGTGKPCDSEFGGMSQEVGSGAQWKSAIWEIRVQGQTSDGVPSRLQATFPVCRAFN
jgi:hypothetical protein